MHDYLATSLAFPAYYGRNLDALNDCLTDICEPTLLVIDADPELADADEANGPSFFERACRVIARAAQENDDITLMDAHEYSAMLDEYAGTPDD